MADFNSYPQVTEVKRDRTLMERIADLEEALERERNDRKSGQSQASESIARLEHAVGFQPLEFPKSLEPR